MITSEQRDELMDLALDLADAERRYGMSVGFREPAARKNADSKAVIDARDALARRLYSMVDRPMATTARGR